MGVSDTKETSRHSLGAMAVLLALFGDACTLLSRIQAEGEADTHLWMMAVGIVASCLVGTAILRASSKGLSRTSFAALHSTALVVVALAVVLRIVVGPQVSFAAVYFLLAAGMIYQVVAWIVLADFVVGIGASRAVALAVGWSFCALNIIGVEVASTTLKNLTPDFLGSMALGLILMLVVGCAVTALAPRRTHWIRGWAKNEPKKDMSTLEGVSNNDLGEKACSVVFEEARDAYEEALSLRLGTVTDQYGLSPREAETLLHLAHGLTLAQIAEEMFVTPGTAKSHSIRLYRKLGVENRQDAVALLVEPSH